MLQCLIKLPDWPVCPQKHLLHPQAHLAAGLASVQQVTVGLCAAQTPGKHTLLEPILEMGFFPLNHYFCYTITVAGIVPESTTKAGVFPRKNQC